LFSLISNATPNEEAMMKTLSVLVFALFALSFEANAEDCECPDGTDRCLSNEQFNACFPPTAREQETGHGFQASMGRPIAVNMQLNVPPGDSKDMRKWYSAGQKTEKMRFKHVQIVRKQGHREWKDRNRNELRRAKFAHRVSLDRRKQTLRERKAAVKNFDSLLRSASRVTDLFGD